MGTNHDTGANPTRSRKNDTETNPQPGPLRTPIFCCRGGVGNLNAPPYCPQQRTFPQASSSRLHPHPPSTLDFEKAAGQLPSTTFAVRGRLARRRTSEEIAKTGAVLLPRSSEICKKKPHRDATTREIAYLIVRELLLF